MDGREKFLNDFSNNCVKWGSNISLYWVLELNDIYALTFSDLNFISDELSVFFSKFFDSESRYIAVEVGENFLLPCIILGLWKNKRSFAGVGIQYDIKNTLNYLDSLNVKYFITDKKSSEFLEENSKMVSSFSIHSHKLYIWRRKDDFELKIKTDLDICYGIMTSGTTGLSKTIQVPWACILLNIEELYEEFHIRESDCIFQSCPCTFDPYFVELFFVLIYGCSLMIVSNAIKLSPPILLQALFSADTNEYDLHKNESSDSIAECNFKPKIKRINRRPITILQMTPSLFNRWNSNDVKNVILSKNTSLRLLILGGEKFPVEILKHKDCDNNKTKIFNIYGITEVSCWAFINEISNKDIKESVPLGRALKYITYRINDEGELLIGSLARICLINEESRFEESRKLLLRNTGDIVEVVNNEIFFVGRSNQIVKKFGMKINLEKIEEAFLQANAIFSSCFCVFDEVRIKLGLFYCKNESNLNELNFKLKNYENFIKKGYTFPNDKLKDLEKPDFIIEMSHVPLNSHGKCEKFKLKKYLQKIQTVKSKSKIHFQNIWNGVLNLKTSKNRLKNFIESGGNSILALQLINKLEDVGWTVPSNFILNLLGGKSQEDCFKILEAERCEIIPKKKVKFEADINSDGFTRLTLRWKYNLGKCIDATPCLFSYQGRERLIIGSHSSRISCIDSDSGKGLWTVSLGGRIESGTIVTEDGSRGFVGCYDKSVYCLSTTNGKQLWKFETGDMIKSTPRLSSDEKVLFVASYDKCLYVLNVNSGHQLKRLQISEKGIYSSGVRSDKLESFFLATLDGTCVSISQTSYEIEWKNQVKSPIFASPCLLDEDRIVFIEVVGVVHCLNACNGSTMWEYEVNGNVYSNPSFHLLSNAKCIVFGCNDKSVHCLRANNEIVEEWKVEMDSSVFAGPCIFPFGDEGVKVCVASTTGSIYLCDFATGKIEGRAFELEGEVFSSPVYKNGKLFVGCRDDNVYALDVV